MNERYTVTSCTPVSELRKVSDTGRRRRRGGENKGRGEWRGNEMNKRRKRIRKEEGIKIIYLN